MFEATQFSILNILGADLAIVDQTAQRSGQKIKINDTITLKIWIKIKILHDICAYQSLLAAYSMSRSFIT